MKQPHLTLVAALLCLSLGASRAAAKPQNVPDSVEWTVPREGVAARFYPAPKPSGSAVLLLVGSEGGFAPPELARSLTAKGHPVLALAYFSGSDEPRTGIPQRLERVPLEYFDRALDRLKAVSHRPLAVIGESRGAEAALLIASRRRDIRVAVAFAPTSHVWQSPGTGGRRPAKPAWTAKGQPLPFAIEIGRPGQSSAADFAEALAIAPRQTRIPVERIGARTLLVAGKDDQIWPSVVMAQGIAKRMREADHRSVQVLAFPAAGHLLMGPGPGLVRIKTPEFSIEFGGTEEGNFAARKNAWQRTLALLDK